MPPPLSPARARQLIEKADRMIGLCASGCEGRCDVCPEDWVHEAKSQLERLAVLEARVVEVCAMRGHSCGHDEECDCPEQLDRDEVRAILKGHDQ